jgi:lipopolysaccharide/colanic/teichoic acid biosynthesis glycosyltransferase
MVHNSRHSTVPVAKLAIPGEEMRGNVHAIVNQKWGAKVAGFINRLGDPDAPGSFVVSTIRVVNITAQSRWQYNFLVNLHPLNDVHNVCRFLADVNRMLELKGRFVFCLETTRQRRKRILNRYSPFVGRIVYFFDYLLNRVVPTVKLTRWLYRLLSDGDNKPISYYEMIGRLTYCGFELEEDEEIDGCHYLAVLKVDSSPRHPRERYGLLLGLDRIGKGGETIKIYKFRTMVAFSEYIQEHIYKRNSLRTGGKFRNDKRVTILGGIFRKCWIDELPMVINIFKGEIKLVGVRPLSIQYLSLYRSEVAKLRTSVKPGLIPPYYVDLPSTLNEIQESEVRYIKKWQKAPFRTDVAYFFRALRNIVCRGARSK